MGRLGQALGPERRKGKREYGKVEWNSWMCRSPESGWGIRKDETGEACRAERQLKCLSVGSVKAFQMMVLVGDVISAGLWRHLVGISTDDGVDCDVTSSQ